MSSSELTTLSDFELLRRDSHEARLLHEFGRNVGFLTREKIRELWLEYSKHDVLFSDYTQGKVEPFLDALSDNKSVWWEIVGEEENPLGLAMLTRVLEGFEATGHFCVWNARASRLIPLFQEMMGICFERYSLRRMNAEVPAYQSGVQRFIRRMGFFQEGEKRKAVPYKGEWWPLITYGILKEELNGE